MICPDGGTVAVKECREEASGTGAEKVGQLVEEVAAALEIVHLQDFDEAAVEDAEAGGDDGCRPFVADADGTEEADEEVGHDEVEAEVGDFIGVGDFPPGFGDGAGGKGAEEEDDGGPGEGGAGKEYSFLHWMTVTLMIRTS